MHSLSLRLQRSKHSKLKEQTEVYQKYKRRVQTLSIKLAESAVTFRNTVILTHGFCMEEADILFPDPYITLIAMSCLSINLLRQVEVFL